MTRVATLLAVLAGAVGCGTAFAQSKAGNDGGTAGTGIPEMDTRLIANGLARPCFLTASPGDTNRVFIVEQRGLPASNIGRISTYQITPAGPYTRLDTFLQVTVSTSSEQGLLGLAFHPDYNNTGYFFIYYTDSGGTVVVARYRANAPYATSNTADAGSGVTVLTIPQPQANHNGGWIAFGPDGYLYLGVGDGGGSGDTGTGHNATFGNGQDINTRLGKMLRIDVDGADNIPGNDDDDGSIGGTLPPFTSPPSNPLFGPTPGLDEIWAYGLRNPWRSAFDRATGELYIADVGQNQWEEINVEPPSTGNPGDPTYFGGRNYGWRCYEGNAAFNTSNCPAAGTMTFPIHAFNHSLDGFSCSVTGGYVYRGTAITGLQGTYFFADYCSNQIRTIQYTGTPNPTPTLRTAELAPGGGLVLEDIVSFAEDAAGEMYVIDLSLNVSNAGEVYKIVQSAPPAPANNNCATGTIVTAGTHALNTANATTDGPNEVGSCLFNEVSAIQNDVWYRFVAQCNGTARASTCGATFDTKIAVYGNACPTAPGSAIACNDDATCGTAAEVTFPVVSGQIYRIRIGSASGATGTGSLVLTCTVPVTCPADIAPAGGNQVVNVDDLLAVINAWGPCADPNLCPADIAPQGGNDVVNVDDLLAVINAWGPCQ